MNMDNPGYNFEEFLRQFHLRKPAPLPVVEPTRAIRPRWWIVTAATAAAAIVVVLSLPAIRLFLSTGSGSEASMEGAPERTDTGKLASSKAAPAEPVQPPVQAPAPIKAERPRAVLEFEMASIESEDPGVPGPLEPNLPGFPRSGFACAGIDGGFPQIRVMPVGTCEGRRVNLWQLMIAAYDIPVISGGPDWLKSEGFQIRAKASDPATATREQLREMLRKFLEDRFTLKTHREIREGYALVVAYGGPKLKEVPGLESDSLSRTPQNSAAVTVVTIKGSSSMRSLAASLSDLGLLVEDETRLNGRFGYALTLNPAAKGKKKKQQATLPEFDPPISTALEEQLGLQLVPRKIPVEVIVIDHAERPSGN